MEKPWLVQNIEDKKRWLGTKRWKVKKCRSEIMSTVINANMDKMLINAVKHKPLPTFEKLMALSANDFHSPTTRCRLNVTALTIFCMLSYANRNYILIQTELDIMSHSALLYWTLFPVDVFFTIQHLLDSTLFPDDVFYFSTFCPVRCLLPSLLCPFVVTYHSTFCPFDVFPIDLLSHPMYCPSTFFTSTFCWWIVLWT
jgi:hypothetical protein